MTNDDELGTLFWLMLGLIALLLVVVYLLLKPHTTITATQLAEAEEDWAKLKPQNREKARDIYREVTR